MRNLSLDYFDLPPERKYHIHRIHGSPVSQEPHSHDYYQICYVAAGHILHTQAQERVQLRAGDAFIVPPGFVHSILFPEEDAQIYSLSFSETLFHPGFSRSNVYRFLTALQLHTPSQPVRMKVTPSPSQSRSLQALLECLLREQVSKFPAELTAAGSLIASILCLLSQSYFSENSGQLEDMARCDRQMHECIAYIDGHFTQPLPMDELTRRFALSRSRFGVLFPQYTGTTLKRYIAGKRVDYAVNLLRTSDLSVSQIAQLTGYSDNTTFYRNFTKITGLLPSHYRNKEKQDE